MFINRQPKPNINTTFRLGSRQINRLLDMVSLLMTGQKFPDGEIRKVTEEEFYPKNILPINKLWLSLSRKQLKLIDEIYTTLGPAAFVSNKRILRQREFINKLRKGAEQNYLFKKLLEHYTSDRRSRKSVRMGNILDNRRRERDRDNTAYILSLDSNEPERKMSFND